MSGTPAAGAPIRLAVVDDQELVRTGLRALAEKDGDIVVVGEAETNDEIGAHLHISPATARTYVSRLLGKLGARDRARLVVFGYESGLVTPGQA